MKVLVNWMVGEDPARKAEHDILTEAGWIPYTAFTQIKLYEVDTDNQYDLVVATREAIKLDLKIPHLVFTEQIVWPWAGTEGELVWDMQLVMASESLRI